MSDAEALLAEVRARLSEALAPRLLEVHDDSHHHAGHPGAREGKHLRVRVVADAFAGQAPLARHRRIHSILADLLATRIHALAIEALAPDQEPTDGANR